MRKFRNRYTKRARDRLRRLADDNAAMFDATLLTDRVYSAIKKNGTLREALDATERAYLLAENEPLADDLSGKPLEAGDRLDELINPLVDETIARECADVARNAREWEPIYETDRIEAAIDEATAWLDGNPEAARRVGVDEANGLAEDATTVEVDR